MKTVEAYVEAFRNEAAAMPRNAKGKVDGRKTTAVINRMRREVSKEGGDVKAVEQALWKAEREFN